MTCAISAEPAFGLLCSPIPCYSWGSLLILSQGTLLSFFPCFFACGLHFFVDCLVASGIFSGLLHCNWTINKTNLAKGRKSTFTLFLLQFFVTHF